MSAPIIEVSNLERLLEIIRANEAQTHAIGFVAAHFAHVVSIDNPTEAYKILLQSIDSIDEIVAEQVSEGGRRRVFSRLTNELRALFSVESMLPALSDYKRAMKGSLAAVEATFPLLYDLTYDGTAITSRIVDLSGEIASFKKKIAAHESVSDSVKVVLYGQADLMEASLIQFEKTGVGPFRRSIFTIFGRICLELKSDPKTSDSAARDIIDDFIRVYDLISAGGSLLRIGAPVIAGLLAAPST